MRTLQKLLLMLLVMAALGAVAPALASQNLDSQPPTADWRFAGPKIRPHAQADFLWDIFFPSWQASFLHTLFHSNLF